MPDQTPAPELSRPLLLAVMDGVEQAVTIVNTATMVQFAQPAQTPAEARARVDLVTQEAVKRLHRLWLALDDADLRSAGAHMLFAFCRESAERASAGVQVLRQFGQAQPGGSAAEAPAPGVS